MLGTYYQFLTQPINAIVTAGVCLIERKHLQLLRSIFHFIEYVLISGDPVLGFVIFNVLLSGCYGCQQWRKATEAMFTQLLFFDHSFCSSQPVPVASQNKPLINVCPVQSTLYIRTAAILVYWNKKLHFDTTEQNRTIDHNYLMKSLILDMSQVHLRTVLHKNRHSLCYSVKVSIKLEITG